MSWLSSFVHWVGDNVHVGNNQPYPYVPYNPIGGVGTGGYYTTPPAGGGSAASMLPIAVVVVVVAVLILKK